MRKMKMYLILVVFTLVVGLNTSPYLTANTTYWKVISWRTGLGSLPTCQYAILNPQECNMTTNGFGWIETNNEIGSTDRIWLMIRTNDIHVTQTEWGAFVFEGMGTNGRPIIRYDIIVGNKKSSIHLNTMPPCCPQSPSVYLLNGSCAQNVEVKFNDPIIMNASYATTSNGKYFISIQLSDQWWNRFGVEAMEWLNQNQGFNAQAYDIRTFCTLKGFTLQKGKYYRLKLAVEPWNETTKLVYIKDPFAIDSNDNMSVKTNIDKKNE